MTNKHFKIKTDQIKPLAFGRGSCIATDLITVAGHKVGYMYREEPDNRLDSGWRFMSGLESQEYMDNANNLELYDVNTIANYDEDIIPLLDSPSGYAFERDKVSGRLVKVDFAPQED